MDLELELHGFKSLEFIAEGAFGHVFKAEQVSSGN